MLASRCRWLALLYAVALALVFSHHAAAETLQAPIGGKPIPLGDARVACEAPAGGWTSDGKSNALRPPKANAAVGTVVELKIAASPAACIGSTERLKLVATGPWPSIDPVSAVFSPDKASVEARGRSLCSAAHEGEDALVAAFGKPVEPAGDQLGRGSSLVKRLRAGSGRPVDFGACRYQEDGAWRGPQNRLGHAAEPDLVLALHAPSPMSHPFYLVTTAIARFLGGCLIRAAL